LQADVGVTPRFRVERPEDRRPSVDQSTTRPSTGVRAPRLQSRSGGAASSSAP